MAALISSVTCGITCTVFAQIIAAPLLGENGFVDSAGRPVVVARQLGVREALVVAEVEIGFGAVVGHVHFAVLIRAHRARIDVQIRIALLEGDSETAAFEQTADRRRCNALAQGGNNTTGNKNILRPHPCSLRGITFTAPDVSYLSGTPMKRAAGGSQRLSYKP